MKKEVLSGPRAHRRHETQEDYHPEVFRRPSPLPEAGHGIDAPGRACFPDHTLIAYSGPTPQVVSAATLHITRPTVQFRAEPQPVQSKLTVQLFRVIDLYILAREEDG